MREEILDISTQMLFAMLRASLQETCIDTSFFENASDKDWRKCYKLAVKQGVMALAWDGLLKLPTSLLPPKALKIEWGTKVMEYESMYHRYCTRVVELSNFYSSYSIAMMQLKGVGFSLLYPIPSHREGGDIDIYTYSADKDRISDTEANKLADSLMIERGIDVDFKSYKHSNFYFKGISVENHKTFLNVKEYKIAVEMEKILRSNMEPQKTKLSNGEILTPSPIFNTLFISFHAFQHYGCGLTLHHLCDWAMILKNYGLQIPNEMTDKKFISGVQALTQLCKKYLGSQTEASGYDDLADQMLNEILNPKFSLKVPVESKIGILIYKTRRLFYNHKLKNKILPSSLFNRVLRSVISHLCSPETIFLK